MPENAAWSAEARYDPRPELVGLVHALARPPRRRYAVFEFDGSAAGQAARRRFAPFARHPAVAAYRDAFRGDPAGPLIFAVRTAWRDGEGFRLAGDPRANQREPGALDGATLARLLEAMNGFARAAGFFAYFAERAARLEPRRRAAEDELNAVDLAALFAEYTGAAVRARAVVYLCPFLRHLSSSRPEPRDGTWEFMTFLGPLRARGGEADFGAGERAAAFWHEIAHAVVDGLVDRHAALLASLRPPAGNDGDCYGSWEQCAREHLAQGLANRLLAWSKGSDRLRAGRPLENRSLRRLRAVELRLAEYERGGRVGLEAFAPRWLAALRPEARPKARPTPPRRP